MAVSEVQICNLALGHLGRAATIQAIRPPDGSAEADDAAQFYDQARDEVTERHAWPWAARRANLALLATNPVTSWTYAYALPNKFLKTLAVYLPGEIDDTNMQPFTVESANDGSAVLYTNVSAAVIKYIVSVSDTSKFTPMFVTAFSWLLAHYMAGPITKDVNVVKAMFQMYDAHFGLAAASVGNSVRNNARRDAFVPAHISARN